MKAYIKVFLPLLIVFIFSGCLANELNTSNAVNIKHLLNQKKISKYHF